ncbi:N-formylglutamate amidohydrolase [Sphingomonas sp. CFBP 8760]|uniref:N-formylglutamate amidohydrolase n=1 Tax=Sphingomonas sp. CFBP 8760 TaxID=2775282 RepID=UPI00178206C8|nr:N-formylglutamate amidohydrolase [Sphingomonas sp. CFBP 8760]MBD8546108.1 N-formylglutamate amidohydrolase [Sphingomonas sp. CFBP 8760]
MLDTPIEPLLGHNDPDPVQIVNPDGRSDLLLIGDHAGNVVPAALGSLGIGPDDLNRHIGWDIGIAGLGEALAGMLDAVFIRQTYSRLVIDCNRDPARADAMPAVSDGTRIPANEVLTGADRAARVAAIHAPYQAAIAAELARRDAGGRQTQLVSLHSFTPAMAGVARPWQVGVLHDRGELSLTHRTLARLRADPTLTVGDNEPYRMDGIDHTVPRHAYPDRPYVELEVRQDLLADAAGVAAWATRLAAVLGE